jgi:hypothetical protein
MDLRGRSWLKETDQTREEFPYLVQLRTETHSKTWRQDAASAGRATARTGMA